MANIRWICKGILFPLAKLWDVIHRLRRIGYRYRFFQSAVFRVPIISVGNLAMGGTGKTPFTLWLAHWVSKEGLTPLILTRGHRGKLEKSHGIIRPQELNIARMPTYYGDEPMVLAHNLTNGAVVVGKDRVANLKRYFADVLPDIVILDDGYQHLKLNRQLNIALFDSLLPLHLYQTVPLGYLRESLSALYDADMVCLSRSLSVDEKEREKIWNHLAPYLRSDVIQGEIDYRPSGPFNGHYQEKGCLGDLKGKEVLALTALASPQSFWKQLELLGATIVEKIVFPDHYAYRLNDILPLLKRVKEANQWILTTEKDMVKIRELVIDDHLLFLAISLEWVKGKDALEKRLKELLTLQF